MIGSLFRRIGFLKIECLILVAMFLKLLYFRHELSYPVFDPVILYANLGLLLFLFAGLILFFKQKMRYVFLIFFNLIITITLFADAVYYRYYFDFISIPLILQAAQLSSVKESIFQLLAAKDLIWFIDFPLILFICKRCCKDIVGDGFASFRYKSAVSIMLLIIGGLSYYIALEKMANPALLRSIWSRQQVVQTMGVLTFHIVDFREFFRVNFTEKSFLTDEEEKAIDEWYTAHNQDKNNKRFAGVAKNRNVIVIQVESLADFVINRKLNGQEITPNLNRLVEGGAYFTNFYNQVYGGNTSDAEFMSNVSLYPAKRGAAFYRYSANEFDSTPKILSREGYKSYVFHAFRPDFWNREIMYNSLGYNDFFDQRDYIINDSVGMGLSDKSFFRQSFDKIRTFKEPYYLSLVTLSSHYPYNLNDKYGEFDVKGYEGNVLGNYFRAIHYTDQALGEFFKLLRENGILDNSVLVVYGDHGAIPPKEKQILFNYLGWEDKGLPTWVKTKKVPLIIRFPNEEIKGKYETLGGQVDLKPTILNLLGVKNHLCMGQDLFNKNNDLLIFPSLEFIKGNVFYSGGEWYDLKKGNKVDGQGYQKYVEISTEALAVSRQLLNYDYAKQLADRIRNKTASRN